MAWRIAEQLPGVERLMPKYGEDWNERLMCPENAKSTPHNAVMKQLWQWHLTAKLLGRSNAYLSRITEVAQDVVKGTPLSDQATAAMLRDTSCLSKTKGKDRIAIRTPQTAVEMER